MHKNTNVLGYIPITNDVIPVLLEDQLDLFTLDSIRARELFIFEPQLVIDSMAEMEGKQVLAADFGGDKGVTKLFIIKKGRLEINNEYEDYIQGNGGEGYLESMERAARFAEVHEIPVGISWGGPIIGSTPHYHPKAKIFLEKLADKYGGDIKNIFPTLAACLNDGPAGAVSAVIETNRHHSESSMIFSINGGGLGMAVFNNGKIYSVEAGHVAAVKSLNKYNQTTACGVYGATYVCIERLGANKAGIEAQWAMLQGVTQHAKEIEDLYKAGDLLAGELYDHSAYVLAHQVVGVAKAFNIDLTLNNTYITGHGGAYKFPYYGERVQQIIGNYIHSKPNLIMTKDFSNKNSNGCLDGAAIAALIQSK